MEESVTTRLQPRALLFAILATGIWATAVFLVGVLPNLERPETVALGITLDLTVVVPLTYYFLVVRPRNWPPVALAPVLVLSLVIAAAILPSDHQQTLRVVEALAIPVEVALLGWVGWQAARALRQIRHSATADPVEELHRSARKFLRVHRVADVFAFELAVLFYAFGTWRSKLRIPDGTYAFTSHRRSGHGGLVFALFVLTVVEGVAVHLLLASWSTVLAWVLTFLSFYGALWLIADYRATVLRPSLVNEVEVWIRGGLRWRTRVPRDQMAAVARTKPDPQECTMSVAFLTTPNIWVRFSAPVLLEGPYGIRRQVCCVGLVVDEPAEFQRLLGSHSA